MKTANTSLESVSREFFSSSISIDSCIAYTDYLAGIALAGKLVGATIRGNVLSWYSRNREECISIARCAIYPCIERAVKLNRSRFAVPAEKLGGMLRKIGMRAIGRAEYAYTSRRCNKTISWMAQGYMDDSSIYRRSVKSAVSFSSVYSFSDAVAIVLGRVDSLGMKPKQAQTMKRAILCIVNHTPFKVKVNGKVYGLRDSRKVWEYFQTVKKWFSIQLEAISDIEPDA